jgi:hypothetical protein
MFLPADPQGPPLHESGLCQRRLCASIAGAHLCVYPCLFYDVVALFYDRNHNESLEGT